MKNYPAGKNMMRTVVLANHPAYPISTTQFKAPALRLVARTVHPAWASELSAVGNKHNDECNECDSLENILHQIIDRAG